MSIDARKMRLGDLVDVRAGYPFRGAIRELAIGGSLVIQMKDVDPVRGVGWQTAIRADLQGRREPSWLTHEDLLLVARGTRFYACHVSAPPEPAVCGPHLFHLRVKSPERVHPAFLAWQLNQPPVQRRLYAAAEGSSQLSVRAGELAGIEVALLPMEQQSLVLQTVDAAACERATLARLAALRDAELAALAVDIDHLAGLGGR